MKYNYPFFKKSAINQFLSEKNAAPLKKWGQNFLIDPNIIEFIFKWSLENGARESEIISEIGPGLGALTHKIIDLDQKKILFEIDPVYIEYLNSSEYLENSNTEIISGNFLDTYKILIDKKNIFLFGNLPYYITSEILSLMVSQLKLSGGIFLVQKEFAERITKEISSLSIFLSFFGEFKNLKVVSPSCFYPSPKTSSAIIGFKPVKDLIIKEIKGLEDFLRAIFWGKRKKIQTSLLGSPFLKKEVTENLIIKLTEFGLDVSKRPEEIHLKQYKEILGKLF